MMWGQYKPSIVIYYRIFYYRIVIYYRINVGIFIDQIMIFYIIAYFSNNNNERNNDFNRIELELHVYLNN